VLCSEVIDYQITFIDSTGADPDEDENRRSRHLFNLKVGVNTIRHHRDWAFARTSASLTLVDGSVKLPDDFLQIGKYGGLFNTSEGGFEMLEEPETTINQIRNSGQENTAVFAIFGSDEGTRHVPAGENNNPPEVVAVPPARLIQVPTNTQLVLMLSYIAKTPDLADSAVHGGDDLLDQNLERAIPLEYHETVVLPYCSAKARESKGDARWKNDQAAFMLGLQSMLRTCRRSQGTVRQLPSFFGRR